MSLSGVFNDADGDALTISASSSNESVATVSAASDGSSLTLSGVAEGTATITVTAQDSDGNRTSDAFDVSVVAAPSGPYAALITQMYEWRNDPQWSHAKPHTDRWDRVLKAFGESVADTSLTAMTAAEAQAFADQGWTRWVEVANALTQIETRYYGSQRPADDHGVRPAVLVVFDDELAAHHFLGVARMEMKRARVEVPLRVSYRAALEREGPLGEAWRTVEGNDVHSAGTVWRFDGQLAQNQ